MKEEFGATLRMRATEIEADNGPGAEQVLAYLARHPDFFLRHEAILAELELPHRAGAAVSLVERQVALLRERNIDSRQRLTRLLETARENDELFSKTRRLILALLEAESLERLAQVLVLGPATRIRRRARAPAADRGCVEPLAARRRAHRARSRRGQPSTASCARTSRCRDRCARRRAKRCSARRATRCCPRWSSPWRTRTRSRSSRSAARDARRFHGEMGTMFMELIGDVLQRLLPRFTGPR